VIATATARAFLGSPEADDAKLAAIIARATATLERDLGFYLGDVAAREVILSGTGGALFVIADDILDPTVEAPIVVAELNADWEWEPIATNLWRRNGRKFYHRTTWPRGVDNLRVQYRAGWAVDTGPGELRDLVLRLVALRYRDSDGDGVQSETLSDFGYTMKDDAKLLEDWNATVKAYSRRLPI